MGVPGHYGLHLPKRCMLLLNDLWREAENVRDPGQPDLGALTSTFLISMSMPIINLPLERFERNGADPVNRYVNDQPINPAAAEAISKKLCAAH